MQSLFKRNTLTRTIFFVAADIVSVFVSVWLAFLLRFDFNVPPYFFDAVYQTMGLTIIILLPVFYFFKLYSFSWAYVSTSELISLFKAVTIAFLLLIVAIFITGKHPGFEDFPRSTILASYVLVFLFCGFVRLAKRIYFNIWGFGRIPAGHRTLIVGAGDAGEQILRSIISGNATYFPVGFVDDNPFKNGVIIHGLKVLGKVSDIPEIAKVHRIEQMIIALPSANSKKIKEAVDFGKKSGIWNIKIAPPMAEIIRGKVSFRNLKDVGVEDLLGREEVSLNTKQIEEFIKNKSVLITGAAGSIGSELSRQIVKFHPKILLLLDQDETGIFNISKELQEDFPNLKIKKIIADVADKEKINKVFEDLGPQIVFHAAAYKHVPLMEENAGEAVKNNIIGTKNVANAAVNYGTEKFIFISTDKAVNPTSVMGCTKRVGEMICQFLNKEGKTKFSSVRFGNVLNSRGSVIPIFREQIKKGGPVQVTHPEMKRYFMLTSEACLLVMQAGAMGKGGEVFVLDMGSPIKILDLAKEMIKLSGLVLDKDIAIVFCGIRPGEKLFEEILTAEEGVASTQNKKIFIAKLQPLNLDGFKEKIQKLESVNAKTEDKEIISALKEAVPSFKNKNLC